MSKRTIKRGDEVEVFDAYADKKFNGTVVDVLSKQFTYQPNDGGNIRFCLFKSRWSTTKEAPCEIIPDVDSPNSNGGEKMRLSDCVALTTSDQHVFEEAIRRTLGLPLLPTPLHDSKISLGLNNG